MRTHWVMDYETLSNAFIAVFEAVNSEEQRIIDVMICNDGKNLNPLEEAEVINRLINFGLKEREISKRTGKSMVYISNLKLLYYAPQKIKNLINENVVSATLAMSILREYDDYSEAVKVIQGGVELATSEGKDKVMKKDIERSLGKSNSFAELKKSFKYAEKEERKVKEDRMEFYSFAKQIIAGDFSKEDFDSFFFEE